LIPAFSVRAASSRAFLRFIIGAGAIKLASIALARLLDRNPLCRDDQIIMSRRSERHRSRF
jgi:hypothetical protein